MKVITLFFIILVFGTCNAMDSEKTPLYVQKADKIIDQFCKDMYKQHKLAVYSTGGGFMDNINKITLGFELNGQRSQEELRELLIEIANNFLERLNSDKEIRSYLIEFPFPPNRLNFSISILINNRRPINKGSTKEVLRNITLARGKIRYDFKKEERKNIQTLFEEPYEEALKIVKKQRPDLFQKIQ